MIIYDVLLSCFSVFDILLVFCKSMGTVSITRGCIRTQSDLTLNQLDSCVPNMPAGDPYFENTFLNASLFNISNEWMYSKTFDVKGYTDILLVFEGIKMGARISVNGHFLGTATNQFIRYIFPLNSTVDLKPTGNVLDVAFDPSLMLRGRFMPCSGMYF